MNDLANKSREELLLELEELRGRVKALEAEILQGKAAAQDAKALRTFFDTAPFPITVTAPEGKLLYANPTAYNFYGLEYEKDSKREVFVPDFYADHEERAAIIRELRVNGEARDFVIKMRLVSGEIRYMSFSAKLFSYQGQPAIISAQFDVTDRIRSQLALKESEEKFYKVFANAPIAMTLSDIESGVYVDVNREFEKASGYSREEVIGKSVLDFGLITAETRQAIIDRMKSNGTMKNIEVTALVRNGVEKTGIVSGDLLTIDGHERLLLSIVDITEMKQIRDEMLKIQRLESLGVLAGGIAHDFNNILTGILGNISLTRTLINPSSDIAERLKECEKACKRAGELSHQLLTFSKGGKPRKKLIRIGPLLEEAVTFALAGSNVRGEVSVEENAPPLEADEGQLSQLFNNLLINAAQAMPNGGIVTITARSVILPQENPHLLSEGNYLHIKIADTGCGIPAENLPKIFDPYFTTKPRGSGLGLSTVFSIARRHDGTVWAGSEPGKGAAFNILLPAASIGPEETLHHVGVETATGGAVLLMDDEPMIRDIAGHILKILGFSVSTAADGAEALVLARDAMKRGIPFDVAILDLTVPGGMGGKEAAVLLAEETPDTILIVSSGYHHDPIIAHYAEYGFSGIIPKPYTMEILSTELKRILAKRGK